MRGRSFARVLFLCAALAPVGPRALAAPGGDPAAAEEAFARGEAAFTRGDFATAAKSFEAAYAKDPHPICSFNAARSWERANEPARAANLYRRFLQEAPEDTPNRDRATASLGELARSLGRIELVAPGARDLEIDGVGASDRVIFVAPGSHLATAAFDGARASRQIAIEPGQTLTVVLQRPAIEPPPKRIEPAPKPLPRPEPRWKGLSPWVFVGLAGATVVAGGLLIGSGVETVLAYDKYEALSDADKRATYDQGKFQQDMTNVLIGVTSGLAAVTAAVGVFAIDWGHGTLVGVGPREVHVVVSF